MMLLQLKRSYPNALSRKLLAGILICFVILFFIPSLQSILITIILSVLYLIGAGVVIYLCRNEVLALKGDAEQVTFSFLIKIQRPDLTVTRQSIDCRQTSDNLLQITSDGKLIAVIRKQSMTGAEWSEVLSYFKAIPVYKN